MLRKAFMWLMLAVCAPACADEVGVVVNGVIMTESEISEEVTSFAKFAGIGSENLNDPMLHTTVSQMMVQRVLIEQFAQSNGLELTQEEKDRAIDGFIQVAGLEEQGLEAYAKEKGLDVEWVKGFLSSQALNQKVGYVVVGSSIKISEEEIADLKETVMRQNSEHLIRSWVLPLEHEKASMDAVKKIKYEWATSGQDPSDGEINNLGWKRSDELPELIVNAIKGIEAGNIVGPLVSEHGYHLVWYEKAKLPALPSDEYFMQVVFQQKFEQAFGEWVEDLVDQSAVINKQRYDVSA